MAKRKPTKRPPADARVEKLRSMCGLGATKCRKVLEASGGDVEAALAALIDAGEVTTDDLDPALVSNELFGRASHRAIGGMFRLPPKSSKLFGDAIPAGLANQLDEAMADIVGEMRNRLEEQGKDFKTAGASARSYAAIKRRNVVLKKKPVVLKLPPFPKLTLTLNQWAGDDVLKTWAGFGTKRGGTGKVSVNISRAPNDGDADPVPPAPEMVAAYAHLKKHEAEVTAAVLDAVRAYLDDTLGRPVRDVKQLKKMMEIGSVHLLAVAKDGTGYVGLFFHCTWDPEHAAGVLLHGSRVVKVGDNETAGDEVAAWEDGGREIPRWRRGLDEYMARPNKDSPF